MKKRFLLISQPNSYRIAPYINAAIRMGLEVLIASRGEHSLITEVHAGLHIDLDDIDASVDSILKEHDRRPFSGILGSDDSTVELAARVARQVNLPHNPPEAARLSRRKDLARAHLSLANCPIPIHCLVDLSQSLDKQMSGLPWPCVLKPLNLSASRGVIRANNKNEFVAACERIKNILAEVYGNKGDEFERSHVLVEEYIEGEEVAYEGYMHEGELHTLAIFDKPDPLTGPYFEETIYVTPSQHTEQIQKLIKQQVAKACKAYGLRTGPIHAELRINGNDAWILEIAARTIGGDCARTLDNGMELGLETLTIALAMGDDVEPAILDESRGVMMIPVNQAGILKRIEGLTSAQKVPNIQKIDLLVRDGSELIPLPEGNQYPGYIFAEAETSQEVIDSLKQAHACLKFVTSPVIKIQ